MSVTSPQRVRSAFKLLFLHRGFQSLQRRLLPPCVPLGIRGLLTIQGHTLTPPGFHLSVQASLIHLPSRQLVRQDNGMRVPWTMDFNANCCSSPNSVLFFSIRGTLETHLDQKGAPVLPGLDNFSEEICLSMGAEVWRLAVDFRRWLCSSNLFHCDA